MDMMDMYSNHMAATLKTPAQVTGDTYTDYIDTADAVGVLFLIHANATTADGSNYIAPKLYGTNSANPETFTNYTQCLDDEVLGSVDATNANSDVINTTGNTLDVLSLRRHTYRYYCFLLDETSTADAIIGVTAVVCKRHTNAFSDTPVTGTVS